MRASPKNLEKLLLNGRADKVIKRVSIDDAARAWCSYQTREHERDEEDPDWWAVWLLRDLIELDDALWREMFVLVIEYAPDDDVLGVAGAGPLEDFLVTCGPYSPEPIAGHSEEDLKMIDEVAGRWLEYDFEERIGWVEEQAAASPKFRKALSGVWIRDDLFAETIARLERAAGCELG